MSIYLSKNNEIEDFKIQYRTVLDKILISNTARKMVIPLKAGYTQEDIHSLNIRIDYGHKNTEGKIKHTNIDLFDVFNNKINTNDDKSFIRQNFDIPSYEWAIHYVFMQVVKYNPLIGLNIGCRLSDFMKIELIPYMCYGKNQNFLFH
jgi:hypothetical protein